MEVNQYLEMFIDESKEHLQACSEHVSELEKNPEHLAIVGEIFSSAHTLKGMSATMGFEDLADLTHKMENVLDAIRNEKIKVTPEILDVVFESVDHLEEMVQDIANGGDGKRDVQSTVELLKRIESGETPSEVAATSVVAPVSDEQAASTSTTELVLTYDDFEKTVLHQSFEQGYKAYEISVALREDCLLKAARVFMVFEILEKNGDVIKSSPTVEKLEEEQFDSQFYVAYISKETAEDLQKKLLKVSEVEKVEVSEIATAVFQGVNGQEQATTPGQVASVQEAEPQVKATDKKSATTNKTNVPTASKTIRVNIERLDVLMNLFEELVIDRGRLLSIAAEVNHSELSETVERMSRTM